MLSIERKSLESLAALALFTFAFLGSEFFFDRRMGTLLPAEGVVGAQALILGASVVGFLAFAALSKLPRAQAWVPFTETAGAIACLIAVLMLDDATALQVAGCAGFFFLGCAGAEAHWNMARAFEGSPSLAKGAGFAYAAGILLQFANNQFIPTGAWEVAMLCAGAAALGALLFFTRDDANAERHGENACTSENANTTTSPSTTENVQPLNRALWSVALVAILACLFSTLDGVTTLSDAQGSIAVDEWPRLFLAASGLVAGIIFDIRERRYMGFVMFGVMLLSIISILAVEAGASPVIGLIVFFFSSGFFVTFFTTMFLQLAPRMRTPQLWAGMGRAANNVCAFTISGASLALTQAGVVAVMIVSIVLFMLASTAFIGAGLFRLPPTAREREVIEAGLATESAPSAEELQAEFIARYGLTPRETDVLRAVTCDERPLKQIADDLGISLRMVQRHLTNIYEKTDTQTRTGLTKEFMGK